MNKQIERGIVFSTPPEPNKHAQRPINNSLVNIHPGLFQNVFLKKIDHLENQRGDRRLSATHHSISSSIKLLWELCDFIGWMYKMYKMEYTFYNSRDADIGTEMEI